MKIMTMAKQFFMFAHSTNNHIAMIWPIHFCFIWLHKSNIVWCQCLYIKSKRANMNCSKYNVENNTHIQTVQFILTKAYCVLKCELVKYITQSMHLPRMRMCYDQRTFRNCIQRDKLKRWKSSINMKHEIQSENFIL